jgi:hypothetical protein
MKTPEERGSYPKYLESIEKNYGDSFTNVTIKLDKLLKAKYDYYLQGSFYNQLLITTASKFKHRPGFKINPSRAIEAAILQALKNTCGEFTINPKSIAADPELSRAINELQSVLKNTAIMIQLQDSFDELKELKINNN